MRKRKRTRDLVQEECCILCKSSEDDPVLFGDKITLKEQKLSVHYFCLLTSPGVYQRGQDDEGVFGFLVEDIKREVNRSGHLKCFYCKKKGACVGCAVRSCRKMVHFPCGRKHEFLFQFTDLFPSYCPNHRPSQSLSPSLDLSLPQSCSVCLDVLQPVLSYNVLKCPSCHTSWFHRDCVQHQAHSAGLFFFRCTLCNNKEEFQKEMLRMGIHIPERDASWELEANAFSELLEVYEHCDAPTCYCRDGRSHSAKTGWFEVIRCTLCGSRGTHRKCSSLKVNSSEWICSDCSQSSDGRASLMSSPLPGSLRRSRYSKRHLATISSPINRASLPVPSISPALLLQSLLPELLPLREVQVEVHGDRVLEAGLELVRRTDFDPTHTLSVRFLDEPLTTFPSSTWDGDSARLHFLKLLVQQLQDCDAFEGPDGCKNLALDSKALREDLYFDVGLLLALSLVHGGPPLGFFSRALYQILFNHPANQPLTFTHMTPDTHLTQQVTRMALAESVSELSAVVAQSREYLQLAGCNRPISSLEDREELVEDLVSFTMITRMQLPLQRLREGLRTLGVFDRVQLFPSVFLDVFCQASDRLSAQIVSQVFAFRFSEDLEKRRTEVPIVFFWRRFLQECEGGRSSVSLEDLLSFITGAPTLPDSSLLPPPSVSFLHPSSTSSSTSSPEKEHGEGGLFPQSEPGSRRLLLPLASSYPAFKSSMEQAVSHHVHLLPSAS